MDPAPYKKELHTQWVTATLAQFNVHVHKGQGTHACVHVYTYPIVPVFEEFSLDGFSWFCARKGGRSKVSSHLHCGHTTVSLMPITLFGIGCQHTHMHTHTELHSNVCKQIRTHVSMHIYFCFSPSLLSPFLFCLWPASHTLLCPTSS